MGTEMQLGKVEKSFVAGSNERRAELSNSLFSVEHHARSEL